MEVLNPDNQTFNSQCSAIIQSGSGAMDQYIYSQDGEGIASFFGNLFRSAIPLFGKAIKGAVQVAKPHLQRAATDIVTTGSKRVLDQIAGDIKRKIPNSQPTQRKKKQKLNRNNWDE